MCVILPRASFLFFFFIIRKYLIYNNNSNKKKKNLYNNFFIQFSLHIFIFPQPTRRPSVPLSFQPLLFFFPWMNLLKITIKHVYIRIFPKTTKRKRRTKGTFFIIYAQNINIFILFSTHPIHFLNWSHRFLGDMGPENSEKKMWNRAFSKNVILMKIITLHHKYFNNISRLYEQQRRKKNKKKLIIKMDLFPFFNLFCKFLSFHYCFKVGAIYKLASCCIDAAAFFFSFFVVVVIICYR